MEHSRYGKLNANELVPPITAGPEVLIELYELWRTSIDAQDPDSLGFIDATFEFAQELVQPYQNVIRTLSEHALSELLTSLPPLKISNNPQVFEKTDMSGLFLSAMFYASELKQLQGIYNHNHLGYKLPADRILVAEKGSNIFSLGNKAEGLLINRGSVGLFGHSAKNAVLINQYLCNSLAENAQDSIALNVDRSLNSLARHMKRGLAINNGWADTYGPAEDDSIHVHYESYYPSEVYSYPVIERYHNRIFAAKQNRTTIDILITSHEESETLLSPFVDHLTKLDPLLMPDISLQTLTSFDYAQYYTDLKEIVRGMLE